MSNQPYRPGIDRHPITRENPPMDRFCAIEHEPGRMCIKDRGHDQDPAHPTKDLDDLARAVKDALFGCRVDGSPTKALAELLQRAKFERVQRRGDVESWRHWRHKYEEDTYALRSRAEAAERERDALLWLWAEREYQDERFWRGVTPPEDSP